MNCNQSTVVLTNASGKQREIAEIPDLWPIAQHLKADPGEWGEEMEAMAAAVLEVWHMAHDLKDAVTEEGEAEVLSVIDPNDLHAVVNYDEDIATDETRSNGPRSMNRYIAYYKRETREVEAESSYDAQKKAAALFRAKHTYDVDVMLAEKNGNPVIHSTAGIG